MPRAPSGRLLPHRQQPDPRDPNVCIDCGEPWADLSPGECPARLRAVLDQESAVTAAWLRRMADEGGDPWMSYCADIVERGGHREAVDGSDA